MSHSEKDIAVFYQFWLFDKAFFNLIFITAESHINQHKL